MTLNRQLLLRILNSPSLRQSFFLTVATVANSILGLIFYILVARNLHVGPFGYFSFLLGIGLLFSELGDLGLGSSLVKFGDRTKLPFIFTITLVQRGVITLVFLVLAAVAAHFYQANFFLSALVASSLLAVFLVTQSLLAEEKYVCLWTVNTFGNILRLIIVWSLIVSKNVSPETMLFGFYGANFAAFGFGLVLLLLQNGSQLFSVRNSVVRLREIFRFSSWITLSFGLSSLAAKIGSPLIYFLGGGVATGIYTSAQKLTMIFPNVAVAIESVFSPKFSKREETKQNFNDYFLITLVIGIATIIFSFVFSPLIPLVLGREYSPAVTVFKIIAIGMSFLFFSGPFSAGIIYHHGKPKYHFYVSLVQLVVSLGLYLFLIPSLGAIGAAISYVLASLISFVLYVTIFAKQNA